MTRLKNANMLLALFLGLAALNASAETEKTTVDSAKSAASNAGEAVDNSINKVGDFMDDSTITARVKAALIDHKDINSGDISVKTENKVVTLSGDVTSAEQKSQALSVAKAVEGVSQVNDKLTVQHKSSSETATLKGYAGDTAITSEVKAKLLADDIVPSRNVKKVETNAGAVHLTGTVASAAQAERAAEIAKAVSGVKSVRNDLSVK
ncbi:TPA: molecular chaperone OsmY [Klebsiella quasipneumoniae subsp. similipneumoniae]|nr:molecular chaperone OsmY [Klebsiella quasipneumoniae subsp. similipneumoniae]